MLNIEILNKGDSKITFVVDDINPQFANAMRRTFMNEIPILAVDYADFSYNNSVLYDEVIAHRLALIPLVFTPGDLKLRDECSCEGKGCTQCQVVLVIDKKGPTIVYSKDMKISNPDVKVAFGNIPIVELKEGQNLKVEATAKLGFGKEHAKWNSSIAHYRYYPNVKLNGKISNVEETIKSCPKRALSIEGGSAKINSNCDLCMECVRIAEPNVLEITGDDTKFIFTVETISGLNAEQIINEGIDVLKDKIKEFKKRVDKL